MNSDKQIGRKTHSFLRGAILSGILVSVLLGATVWANIWKRDLRLSAIRIEGNRIVTTREILKLADVPKNQKLYDIDLYAVQKRIQGNAFIGVATVNREVPDQLVISVVERVPVAAVLTDRLSYLDADGVVLPAVRSEQMFDLPVLTGTVPAGECMPGRRISTTCVREALGLLLTAKAIGDDLYHRISEVHICENGDLILHTVEFGVPVVVGRGDVPDKLVKFDGFWKQIVTRRDARALHFVDLRFADRVIVRWDTGDRPVRN